MKSLHELIAVLPGVRAEAWPAVPITQLTADSRQVQPGSLFVAWQGKSTDGHAYVPEALARGAAALVVEKPTTAPPGIPIVQVSNARLAYALLCSRWFDHPEENLTLVGITGTNGKSSTTYFLYQLWRGLGHRAGLIGTVFCLAEETIYPATLTTPDSYELYRLLRLFADQGITHVAMEVSSIALDQQRTAGLPFAGAVFTNLTHDHLDYHGTFTAYRDAKKRLFDDLAPGSFALLNIDDPNGSWMGQNTPAGRYGYSLQQAADFSLRLRQADLWGLQYELKAHLMPTPAQGRLPFTGQAPNLHAALVGRFQAYNLLAAVAAAFLSAGQTAPEKERQDLWHHLAQLSTQLKALPGRLERVPLAGKRLGLVDYAHTPDAVAQVLRMLRSLLPEGGQLIAVLGAGGDRDRSKRGPMAKAAAAFAHRVLLTSDNPRSEDPLAILEEMQAGVPAEMRNRVIRIPDRAEAIRTAVSIAPPHSLIAVLGKGHETYQEIQGVRYPFSDRAVLEAFQEEPYAG